MEEAGKDISVVRYLTDTRLIVSKRGCASGRSAPFTRTRLRGSARTPPANFGNFTHAARTGDVAQNRRQQRRIVRFQNVSDTRRLPHRCREPAPRRTEGRDLIEGIGAMKVDWLHRVNGRGMLDEASLRGAPTMGSGGLCSRGRSHQRFQDNHPCNMCLPARATVSTGDRTCARFFAINASAGTASRGGSSGELDGHVPARPAL